MVMWLGIGVAAVLVVVAPADTLSALFPADDFAAELLRIVAAVTIVWSLLESRATWRSLERTPTWRVAGWVGLTLLVLALLLSYPTALFFSFPLIVGASLSTAMTLAESWRESVLAAQPRRRLR